MQQPPCALRLSPALPSRHRHIWDFVQQSCDATAARKAGGGKLSDAEKSLTAAVEEVNSHEGMQNNPNIKFRSFVCCGLNHRHLGEWVRVLTDDSETMGKFYESWAFVLKKEVGAVRHVTRTHHHAPSPPLTTPHTHRLPLLLPLQLKQMIDYLQPLGGFAFALSLDFELTKWDL